MKKTIRCFICLFLTVVLAVSFCTTVTYGASKTVKAKSYVECIKSGKFVYCNTDTAIYKVNVKKGTKKKIVSVSNPKTGLGLITSMQLHKGYIYYEYCPNEEKATNCIYRVKKSGKSKKKLAEYKTPFIGNPFAVKGKKVYYFAYANDYDENSKVTMQMKLNGKKKAKTNKKVKVVFKKTNKKGYNLLTEEVSEDVYKIYLKTPKKKIFLCNY